MYQGFVACGGFSYGDTLGAGEGWARSIRFNAQLADQFATFFARPDVFALGICNGCQMMAALADMIPGAAAWPRFTRNRSEQFEARLSLVEVLPSPSIFFGEMAGSRLPIAVAHGEGFADFSQRGDAAKVQRGDALRRPRRPADRGLSGESERQRRRPDGGHDRGRPLHGADAARRARLPPRPAELVAGRRGRGQRLGARCSGARAARSDKTRRRSRRATERETSVAVKRKTIGELRSQRWFSAPSPVGPHKHRRIKQGGFSLEDFKDKPVIAHPLDLVRLPDLPRPLPAAHRGDQARHLAGGRIPGRDPGAKRQRELPAADQHALSQPAGDGGGGGDPRPSGRRRRAARRLRQDRPRPGDGAPPR